MMVISVSMDTMYYVHKYVMKYINKNILLLCKSSEYIEAFAYFQNVYL